MSRSRKPVNPAAQQALNQLKEETAAEIGLKDYKNTYKGALTSADNGRVGGQMVRKMIQAQEESFAGTTGQSNMNSTLTAKYDANNKP
ncbi:MAG: alpha/beta-type small acid-soluble spore protein [Sporomusaceae bacterium]|nr:alpha/beta-type small acid-soluble spore protein [Sporomusaceae bacterium]